jgi:hypothetical protein
MGNRRPYRKRKKLARILRVLLLLLLIPVVIYVDFWLSRPPRIWPSETYVPAELAALGMHATGVPDPPWELPYSELLALDLGTRLGWPGGNMELWQPLPVPRDEHDAAIWGDESLWEYKGPPVGVYRGSPLAATPSRVSDAVPHAEVQSPIANWISLGSTGLGGLMPWEVNSYPPPVVDPADFVTKPPDVHLVNPPLWTFFSPPPMWVPGGLPSQYPAAPPYNLPPVLIAAGFQNTNLILVWAPPGFRITPPAIGSFPITQDVLTVGPPAPGGIAAPPGSGAGTAGTVGTVSTATLPPFGRPVDTTNLPEPHMTLLVGALLAAGGLWRWRS